MHQPHISQQHETKRLGSQFVQAALKGEAATQDLFERIVTLPGSSAALLADAALELCSVRPSRTDSDVAYRAHLAGARLITHCGLSFDPNVVNTELVPLLARVPRIVAGQEQDDVWRLRLQRVLALCQLAPRLTEEKVDEVLRSTLLHAEVRGRTISDLFVPLAGFEEFFRSRSFDKDVQLRDSAQAFCLDSIARLLELTVEGLAEAEQQSFSSVLRIFPWTTMASVAFLTIAPSATQEKRPETEACIERILDSAEWLLRRPVGFPGHDFGSEQRSRYEAVRSIVGLAVGALVIGDESYEPRLRDMKLPLLEGPSFLGTAFLQAILSDGPKAASERFAGVADLQLRTLMEPNDLMGQESVEITALAWHLGAGGRDDFAKAMEYSRNPSAQLFSVKALNDKDPWNRSDNA